MNGLPISDICPYFSQGIRHAGGTLLVLLDYPHGDECLKPGLACLSHLGTRTAVRRPTQTSYIVRRRLIDFVQRGLSACQLCAIDTDNSINVSLWSKKTFYSAKKNQVHRHTCQYLTLKSVCIIQIGRHFEKAVFIQCQNDMEPENIDIDTKIKFLSSIFAEIWDIENSHRPFFFENGCHRPHMPI